MGDGLSDGGQRMERVKIRKVGIYRRPTCDALIAYMLGWGLNIDVPVEQIMQDMSLVMVGGNGFGPYPGRINQNELRKRSAYRLVVGKAEKTYRLIALT